MVKHNIKGILINLRNQKNKLQNTKRIGVRLIHILLDWLHTIKIYYVIRDTRI